VLTANSVFFFVTQMQHGGTWPFECRHCVECLHHVTIVSWRKVDVKHEGWLLFLLFTVEVVATACMIVKYQDKH